MMSSTRYYDTSSNVFLLITGFVVLLQFIVVCTVRPVNPYTRYIEEVAKTLETEEESRENSPDDENRSKNAEDDSKVKCCQLGSVAGDKGYHCFPLYYAARIVMRNRNRAHNRKMPFHGRFKIQNYGVKTMKSFEQCVYKHASVFRHCCRLALADMAPLRIATFYKNKRRYRSNKLSKDRWIK